MRINVLYDYIPQDILYPHGSYIGKKEERQEGYLSLLEVVFGDITMRLLMAFF